MSKKKSGMQIYTKQDKAILYCGYALLAVFLIAIIVPMVYIVIASFMDPVTLQNKGISFDFSKWSLDAYERVISDKQIWVGFKNAVLYSVIFTVISVAVTMLAAIRCRCRTSRARNSSTPYSLSRCFSTAV